MHIHMTDTTCTLYMVFCIISSFVLEFQIRIMNSYNYCANLELKSRNEIVSKLVHSLSMEPLSSKTGGNLLNIHDS